LPPRTRLEAADVGLAACAELDARLAVDDPRRGDLQVARCTLYGRRAELEAALAAADALLDWARRRGSLDHEARALGYRGNFLARTGALAAADAAFVAALEIPCGPAVRGQNLGFRGNLARSRGDPETAEAAYEAAHAAFLEAGGAWEASSVRFGTAALAWKRGEYALAAAHLAEARANTPYTSMADLFEALLEMARGRYEAAHARARAQQADARARRSASEMGLGLAIMVAAASASGRWPEAEEALSELAAVRPYTVTASPEYREALELALRHLASRPDLHARAAALLPAEPERRG